MNVLDDVKGAEASAFVRGDHTELCERLIDDLGGERRVKFADLAFWRVEKRMWRAVQPRDVCTRIMSYAGSKVGDKGTIRVNAGDVKGIKTLAAALCDAPDWFATAPCCVLGDTVVRAIVPKRRVVFERLKSKHRARDRGHVVCLTGGHAAREERRS